MTRFPDDDRLLLRPARDLDAPGLIALVGGCFAEYPGCVLHVDDEEPSLLRPESAFARAWVLVFRDEGDERVFGSIACSDVDIDGRPGGELKKCYLHPFVRGRGWATRLVALVEAWARDRGHELVELWSDTRFRTAHAVYEHLGYVPSGRQRALHDRSATVEFHFRKRLP